MKRSWRHSEDVILRQAYSDRPTAEVARVLRRTLPSIYQRANVLGLSKSAAYLSSAASGRIRDGVGVRYRFPKGGTPWNKGKKGWQAGGRSAETRFKKGEIRGAAAQKRRPIGSTSTVKDGHTLVKVSETGNRRQDWRYAHVMAFEKEHGAVPRGHVVLKNMRSASRAELMGLNTFHRYPEELKHVMRLARKLERKIEDANQK